LRRIITFIISLITLLSLKAQECSSLWLSCPSVEGGRQVLYSRTFPDFPNLNEASVVISTNGYFRLYINGSLVTVPSYPFTRAPYRGNVDKKEIISTKLDISRFVRNGYNTISLLCSPSDPAMTTAFSLRLTGSTIYDQPFALNADESWLCRPLGDKMLDYHSEFVDGSDSNNIFEMQSTSRIMDWLPTDISFRSLVYETTPSSLSTYEYISKVIKPNTYTIDDNRGGVLYDFGDGFYGLLRVTLRNTKRGQRIKIAGSEYICKGKIDEQFITHFSGSWFRTVYISGDNTFRPNAVSVVEGLQIVPKNNNNLSFYP